MTHNLKELGRLEKDILKNASGNFPLLILDTGALIDIIQTSRDYCFCANRHEKNSNYEKATYFLKDMSSHFPLVITPKTYQEIQDHGRMRLNAHETELSPKIVDFALNIMINSVKFISGLKAGVELDMARYDAYWASQEGCKGNLKKMEEGCSDTDREILTIAAFLSQCRTVKDKRKKIGRILVASSDTHIIKGSEFLKRGFGGKYSNITSISTRY